MTDAADETPGPWARASVFLMVLVVVVGVTVLAVVSVPSGPRDTSVGYPGATSLVPDVAGATDDSEPLAATNDPRVVLVDLAHANRISPEDLRPFVAALGPNHDVRYVRASDDFEATLSEADALIVADPGLGYSEEETRAVVEFVRNGGRLVLLGEPTRVSVQGGPLGATLVRSQSRVHGLAARFDVSFGTEYLYDEQTNEGNFKRVYASGRGDLAGARIALYTATTVSAPDGTRLLLTPETTRLSANSDARRQPVAVRDGNVLAVGDTTFLQGGKHVVVDNERLVATIAQFAVTSNRSRTITDYPHFLDGNPRIRYTDTELLNASKSVASGLRDEGLDPTLSIATAPTRSRTDVLVTTFSSIRERDLAWTNVTVTDSEVSVRGYRGPRSNTVIVHRLRGTDSVVVASASAADLENVTGVLTTDGLRDEALSDTTVVVRLPGDVTDGDATDDDGSSGETEPVSTPPPLPSVAAPRPGRSGTLRTHNY